MKNQKRILDHIQRSDYKLEEYFTYNDINDISKLVSKSRNGVDSATYSGADYASQRFIQEYCHSKNLLCSDFIKFAEDKDPRRNEFINEVKNAWSFKLKDSVLREKFRPDIDFNAPNKKEVKVDRSTSSAASKIEIRNLVNSMSFSNKSDYLQDVSSFVAYLCNSWNSFDVFCIENRSNENYRKSDALFSSYNSLSAAFDDYQWNKKSFIESTKELIVFRENILDAIKISNECKAYIYINHVLRWGGVLTNTIAGNFLDKHSRNELTNYIDWSKSSFDAKSTNLSALDSSPSELLSDSGATKIYTLVCDQCIIYDDRVAAALCLLISKFLGDGPLPVNLELMAGNRSSKKTNRDPSTLLHRFPSKKTGHEHAKSNLKANWLVSEVAKNLIDTNDSFKQSVKSCCKELNFSNEIWVAMRIIETSLFMAGHSVPYTPLK